MRTASERLLRAFLHLAFVVAVGASAFSLVIMMMDFDIFGGVVIMALLSTALLIYRELRLPIGTGDADRYPSS